MEASSWSPKPNSSMQSRRCSSRNGAIRRRPSSPRRRTREPEIYDEPFEAFWEREGRERLTWFEPFGELYEWKPPYAKWFLGGTLNVCFNCVDRHVEAGNGEKVAYHWEGEPATTFARSRMPTCSATSSVSRTR